MKVVTPNGHSAKERIQQVRHCPPTFTYPPVRWQHGRDGRLGRHRDGEEIRAGLPVTEPWLPGHARRRSFDPERGGFDAWLATILVRRVRNARRADRRWRALRAVFGMTRASREAAEAVDIDRVEARLVLDRLVSCLSDSQRDVVALYEIAQLTADEVARVLGHTPAGVRSIARDARIRLAEAARRTCFQKGNHDDR